MPKYFLWCRAWPWYLTSFPFERFDELDGAELWSAMRALAQQWHEEHPGAIAAERERTYRTHLARINGQPLAPRPDLRKRAVSSPNRDRPPTFEEVALLVPWAVRPSGIVVESSPFRSLTPSARMYIHSTDDARCASGLLDPMRTLISCVPPGDGYGSGFGRLRYGIVDAANLDLTRRIVITRSLQKFRSLSPQKRGWCGRIAEEAAQVEDLLRGDFSEDSASSGPQAEITEAESAKPRRAEKVPGKNALKAAASYRWLVENYSEIEKAPGRGYRQAYKLLRSAIQSDRYTSYGSLAELPGFETWKRYVRDGSQTPDVTPPKGEEERERGPSIVDFDAL